MNLETFDALNILGGGTLGSIVTMLTQKILSKKADKTDLITNQVHMLNDVNIKLNEVVTQLQELACYRDPCKKRVNGGEIEKRKSKIKTEK